MTRLFKTWLLAATRAASTMVATALVATVLVATVLVATVLVDAGAAAQEPVVDLQSAMNPTPMVNGYLTDEPVVDTSLAEAYGPELPHGPKPVPDGQPVNWISGPYLKAGVALGFDGSILDNQDPGYTISAGFRQPLSPSLDERLFIDLGGSYLGVFGETSRSTSGIETTRNAAGNIEPEATRTIANVFQSTLTEVQRATAHAAVGWYWGDPLDFRSSDPQLRLATRIGGRYGHFHGEFDDVLNNPANIPVNPQFPIPPNSRTFATNYSRTDTSGGLFIATEMILLNRDFAGGSVQFTLDSEYANDWISFKGWNSGSLGSGSIMAGFMYSR